MKSVGPIIEIYAGARPEPRRRVEKASISSGLEDQRHRRGGPAILNAPITPSSRESRFETNSTVGSLGEGIPAGFIAQILGQVLLTKRPDPASGLRAYARAESDPGDLRLIRWA